MNTEFEKQNIFGLGPENTAFAQYFIGKSYLKPLVEPGKSPIFLANVTFEPGCRNNWHIHRASGGGSGLRGHNGAHEHAVLPASGLIDQGGGFGPASAEDDGA